MKGISSVIAIILLLLITIAIVGVSSVFLQTTVVDSSTIVEDATSTQIDLQGQKIEFVTSTSDTVTIKSVGTSSISTITVLVDGTPVTATSVGGPLEPGKTGTFQLSGFPSGSGERIIDIIAGGNTVTIKKTINVGTISLVSIDNNDITITNTGDVTIIASDISVTYGGQILPFTLSSDIQSGQDGTLIFDVVSILESPQGTLEIQAQDESTKITQSNFIFYAPETMGYYKFDDLNTGKTINDYSGRNKHGTFIGTTYDGSVNGATSGTGIYGDALVFDGTNDWVDTTDSLFDFGASQDFSYSLWFKTTTTATSSLINKRGETGSGTAWDGFALFINSQGGTIDFNALARDTEDDTVSVFLDDTGAFDDEWHHVAVTYDKGNIVTIYLDGVLGATESIANIESVVNDNTLAIGVSHAHNPDDFYFDGSIDEVRIYNKVLTDQDIIDDMNSMYPLNGVIASYSFENPTNRGSDTQFIIKGEDGSGALSLNGVNEYVTVNSGSSFGSFSDLILSSKTNFNTIPSSRMCVICWATNGGSSDNGNGFLFYKSDSSGRWGWQVNNGGSGDTTFIPIEYNPTINTWYHFVGSLDNAGALKLYLDGIERASDTGVSQPISGNDIIRIGARTAGSGNDFFDGIIDEVRILNGYISP
jgi:flagellin-like protein